MSKAHKHADLMARYAMDATETDKPWERWELLAGRDWMPCSYNPTWAESSEFRRRKPQPETVEVSTWKNRFGNINTVVIGSQAERNYESSSSYKRVSIKGDHNG